MLFQGPRYRIAGCVRSTGCSPVIVMCTVPWLRQSGLSAQLSVTRTLDCGAGRLSPFRVLRLPCHEQLLELCLDAAQLSGVCVKQRLHSCRRLAAEAQEGSNLRRRQQPNKDKAYMCVMVEDSNNQRTSLRVYHGVGCVFFFGVCAAGIWPLRMWKAATVWTAISQGAAHLKASNCGGWNSTSGNFHSSYCLGVACVEGCCDFEA